MDEWTIKAFRNLRAPGGLNGGQGVFYAARCNGADVVLKSMSVAPDAAPCAFEAVTLSTARLVSPNHPGVVRDAGCFQHENRSAADQVAVVQRMRGETLKRRLMREVTGMGAPETLRMARECLKTLADLSAVGVLRRDLTPSNIFLEINGPNPGEGDRFRLIDFEAGKDTEDVLLGQPATNAADLGRRDYMAPELFGTACATVRSEIFTFALILHEALTGMLPYERGMLKQTHEPVHPLPVADRLVPGLGTVLDRCFAREPAARPVSLLAFLEDISRLEPAVLTGRSSRRYRLLRMIGKGGFGQVYQAEAWEDGGGLVAVKYLMDNRYADRFECEAATLQRFNDPRIVAYMDQGGNGQGRGDSPFVCMRYLDQMPGASLHERLKTLRETEGHPIGLPEAEVREAFIRYAGGLRALHRAKTYHRDIKPANLYLPSGRADMSCIMDLGSVRRKDAAYTQNSLPGSPDYMPPEFAFSAGCCGSPASDVYALGLCLFEALTGHYLYGEHSKKAYPWEKFCDLVSCRIEPDYAPLEQDAPRYVKIVSRMTACKADERADMDEVIRTLQNLSAECRRMPAGTVAGGVRYGAVRGAEKSAAQKSSAADVVQRMCRSLRFSPIAGTRRIAATLMAFAGVVYAAAAHLPLVCLTAKKTIDDRCPAPACAVALFRLRRTATPGNMGTNLQAVERMRKSHAEIIRKMDDKNEYQNQYAQGKTK